MIFKPTKREMNAGRILTPNWYNARIEKVEYEPKTDKNQKPYTNVQLFIELLDEEQEIRYTVSSAGQDFYQKLGALQMAILGKPFDENVGLNPDEWKDIDFMVEITNETRKDDPTRVFNAVKSVAPKGAKSTY